MRWIVLQICQYVPVEIGRLNVSCCTAGFFFGGRVPYFVDQDVQDEDYKDLGATGPVHGSPIRLTTSCKVWGY